MPIPLPLLLKRMADDGASALFLRAGSPPLLRFYNGIQSTEDPPLKEPDILNMFISNSARRYQTHFYNHGSVSFTFELRGVGLFRANWYRLQHKVSATIRLIRYHIPSIEEIGLTPDYWLFPSAAGLTLVAGAIRSGRTSTLSAIIDRLNADRDSRICLIHNGTHPPHRDPKGLIENIIVGDDAKDVKSAVKMAIHTIEADSIAIDGLYGRNALEAIIIAARCGLNCYASVYGQSVEAVLQNIFSEWPHTERERIQAAFSAYLNLIVCQALVKGASSKKYVLAHELLYCTKEVKTLIEIGRIEELRKLFSEDYSSGMHISMEKSMDKLIKLGIISKGTKREFFDRAKRKRRKGNFP